MLVSLDLLVGIPRAVFAIIAVGWLFLVLREINQRLETLEQSEQLGALAKRVDRIDERLRWIEFWLFGADREDVMSEAWSARQRDVRAENNVDPTFDGLMNEYYKDREVFRNSGGTAP
jgi:hypothetical protein